MEGDPGTATKQTKRPWNFNPLPPHGGRPQMLLLHLRSCLYFNPLPPHGGRPLLSTTIFPHNLFQSTPSAWRETVLSQSWFASCSFQSTPSAWRETVVPVRDASSFLISIHSLRMEGDAKKERRNIAREIISIHSLRMEGDRRHRTCRRMRGKFQSTPSAWRETCYTRKLLETPGISIHSLRMEGDYVLRIDRDN